MQTKGREDEVMAKYLLGELSDSQQEAVEEKMFVDNDWFDRLSVVEMELIDDYVQGRLSTKERSQFERGFLTTPDRIEKVATAKTLMRHVEELRPFPVVKPETPTLFWRTLAGYFSFQSPAMRYAMATAVLLLTVGGVLLVYDSARLRQQVYEARNQQSTQAQEFDEKMRQQRADLQKQLDVKQKELEDLSAQSQSKNEEIDRLKSEMAALRWQQNTISLGQPTEEVQTLLATKRRTNDNPQPVEINLNQQTKELRLQVQVLAPSALRYKASLVPKDGATLKDWNDLKPRSKRGGQFLFLTVPTRLLKEGDYLLMVRRASDRGELVGTYRLRLLTK